MSKKTKHKKTPSAPHKAEPMVNTLGIDIEPQDIPEQETDLPENTDISAIDEQNGIADEADGSTTSLWGTFLGYDEVPGGQYGIIEKVISYSTLVFSVLLLIGSIIFWFVIIRHLVRSPDSLADAGYMSAILICSGVMPIFVAGAQTLLARPINVERWLICMCLSGALAALMVIFYQLGIRSAEFTFSDLPILICCTISGSTLSSAICTLARWLLPKAIGRLRSMKPAAGGTWEEISSAVSSIGDFDDFDF